MLDDFDKQPSVTSPDGTKVVQLATEVRFPALGDKEYKFRVLLDGVLVSTLEFPDLSANIEVGWSPDSRSSSSLTAMPAKLAGIMFGCTGLWEAS